MIGPAVTGVNAAVSIRCGPCNRITTFPFTMWIASSLNAISSTVFHSPVGFSLSGALILGEVGPVAGRVVVEERRRRAPADLGANGDRRADRIEITDIALLDLQLDRTRPRPAVDARLGVDVIQQ